MTDFMNSAEIPTIDNTFDVVTQKVGQVKNVTMEAKSRCPRAALWDYK